MVKLSKMVEYSILLLTSLGNLREGEPMSARFISDLYELPYPTVSKILKILSREGIVESAQGPKGGYKLYKETNQINIKMLMDIFDGKSNIVSCLRENDKNICHQINTCSAKGVMSYVDNKISKIFENITIEKLIMGEKILV